MINLSITCSKCGRPITHANEFGMFCDQECSLEEAKEKVITLDNALEEVDENYSNILKKILRPFTAPDRIDE